MSADDWVRIFVLFAVQMRHPAQGATGGWVMPGLVFKWFPLCEFYVILPRVSSMVVQGLGVSAPTPKVQGLISSFAWFYVFFSTGQVLLSTLSWCAAHTSVSEGVFLMYPWREIHCMSTYSSTVLFQSSPSISNICFLKLCSYIIFNGTGYPTLSLSLMEQILMFQ